MKFDGNAEMTDEEEGLKVLKSKVKAGVVDRADELYAQVEVQMQRCKKHKSAAQKLAKERYNHDKYKDERLEKACFAGDFDKAAKRLAPHLVKDLPAAVASHRVRRFESSQLLRFHVDSTMS